MPSAARLSLRWTSALLIGACIALCHLPGVRFGFLDWDDDIHVTQNAQVTGARPVTWRERLLTPTLGYPIPVTVASYELEADTLGLVPWHFHLLNVLLHVANSVWLFVLALRLGLSTAAAACAALLFGLHPVVAEPVTWITGRKDVLAAQWGLTALGLAWPTRGSAPTRMRRLAAVSCYLLGLLSKPAVAPLALLIALVPDDLPNTWRSRARKAAPYLAVLTPVLVLGVVGQRAAGAIVGSERAGAGYVRAAWYALGHHLRLLLGLEEPTAKYLPVPWPPAFTPGVDLLPLAAAAFAAVSLRYLPRAQRKIAIFGLFWAVLTYLPNANLLPLARYLSDSYVYLPLIGFALYVAACADAVLPYLAKLTRPLVTALPALIIVICLSPMLRSQARFNDDLALWAHARHRYPESPRVCRQWANAVSRQHGAARGLDATDHCIARFGDNLFVKNRGMLLATLGRTNEARVWLQRASQTQPSDPSIVSTLLRLSKVSHP